ncbi:MAG: metal-dependent hydrolase [Deltaproteobacteria bacterium RBG_19FT_COMBO_43_11]|nr:MAG: metal-dependent hydrolase [Deltaproteobacteria bacterium RBG_16_44_11]OGP88022.1 MAG: metal-dependent hydrolase [Deltaproteobacteria bacterium RBG_19FT_COMBO_43_11]
MIKIIFAYTSLFLFCTTMAIAAEQQFESDKIKTSGGDLIITFIGHGTLMMSWGGKIIHVDPVLGEADYSKLPKADLIIITHEHSDHFDLRAIDLVKMAKTKIVANENVAKQLSKIIMMKNGDIQILEGFRIEAVPAYNIEHMRTPGVPFHPKGAGNGYIVTFGDKRVYIAGDTENTPEMKKLTGIDIAFLPMNLPYTMTPEMVADAAKSFRPKILYPYHYGNTNIPTFLDLLKGETAIEVRIRKMQ